MNKLSSFYIYIARNGPQQGASTQFWNEFKGFISAEVDFDHYCVFTILRGIQ